MIQPDLIDIFREFPLTIYTPIPNLKITGIASDSRQVKPGNLFVALSGGTTDGHQYIPDALSRGASVVLGTQPLTGLTVPYIRVIDSRQSLAHLAAGYYGFPARQLTVVGVTGTDGKTTTVNLIYSILKASGIHVGMISTVNAVIGDRILDTGFHVTTPDAPDVQYYLAQMVDAGISHVVLEATSHGLAQYRVDACEFDVGVVTNITHEHLDYHGTYEFYRAAKARLFTSLEQTLVKSAGNPRAAVLNRDDISYEYLSSVTTVRKITYGFHPDSDVRPEGINQQQGHTQFDACSKNYRFRIVTQLFGDYNVSNCLAAIAATVDCMGINTDAARKGIAEMPDVPGRMERMDLGQDFIAIVDFAHTPNALKCSLVAARKMMETQNKSGRMIAVFGSAGLRDRAKRRMMAEVSAELADLTILTAEDPRTESLDAILSDMASGAISRGGVEGLTFWRVQDRGEALRFAVSLARPGDLVIACGKGHEQSMCFGEIEYPWDDRIALGVALAEHLGISGPAMPYLPTRKSV